MRAALFDMDGVLVATESFYNARRDSFIREVGLNLKEGLDFSGYSEGQMWMELVPDDACLRETLKERYKNEYCALHPTPWKELQMPKMKETLVSLKERGVALALCSSSHRHLIDEMLDTLGLSEVFDISISGAEVTAFKPDPAIYLEAAKRLSVAIDECVVVEDSPIGIEAGKRAGAYVVALKTESLDQSKADVIIDSLAELDSYFL